MGIKEVVLGVLFTSMAVYIVHLRRTLSAWKVIATRLIALEIMGHLSDTKGNPGFPKDPEKLQ